MQYNNFKKAANLNVIKDIGVPAFVFSWRRLLRRTLVRSSLKQRHTAKPCCQLKPIVFSAETNSF
jgi:hypothetical protein